MLLGETLLYVGSVSFGVKRLCGFIGNGPVLRKVSFKFVCCWNEMIKRRLV